MRAPATLPFPQMKTSRTRLGGVVVQGGGYIPGGVDLETPVLDLQPGVLRDVQNWQVMANGGYGRIKGYERVDGQFSPTDASFTIVQVLSFSVVPTAGQTISQASSGATGTVALVVDSGSEHYMVVTDTVGTFDTSGVITVSITTYTVTQASGPLTVTQATSPFTVPYGVTLGTAIPTTVVLSALLTAMYTAAAADVYRDLIQPVPGNGNILGVTGMVFNGASAVYAFRASENNQQVNLYKTTSSGWEQVPFFNIVAFTDGRNVEPTDGEVINQGAVTAIIKRTMTQGGAYDAQDAYGQLVVTDSEGGTLVAGEATTASGATVTLSAIPTPITLRPGGRFQFVKGNFTGQLSGRRLFGCDGINKAFEFDGTTLAPISTGIEVDAPSNIAKHKDYLFLSYQASVLFCAPGLPFNWTALSGAGEIATGNTVTGMMPLAASTDSATLVIYLRNSLGMLYGKTRSDFNFVELPTGTGGMPYSAQNMSDGLVFDDEAGVISLSTTLRFGNFVGSSYSKNLARFVKAERTKVTASSINRELSQYRVFFSDGYALWATIVNQQYIGSGIILFPNPVFCADSGENTDGTEPYYFGSSDGGGYVYQFDVGTSFDGEEIPHFATLAWDHIKSPRMLKTFRGVSLTIENAPTYVAFEFGWRFDYGSTQVSQPEFTDEETNFQAAPAWDSFTWDAFIWDGYTATPNLIPLSGDAENVQITVRGGTNYMPDFTMSSVIYHYTMRRMLRVG